MDRDILDYLPEIMQKYDEIKVLMVSEQAELEIIEEALNGTMDNAFIMDSNLAGITRYEKMLGITPNVYDTLEARRVRIMARWNNMVPYTYRELIKKLDALCGKRNYVLEPDFNSYQLGITTNLQLSSQVEELEKLLNNIVPCNILFKFKNIMDIASRTTLYLIPSMTSTCMVEIKTEPFGMQEV